MAAWISEPGGQGRLIAARGTGLVAGLAARPVRGRGVRGQPVTPAVLAMVHELSGGRSAAVNRQLIADNAGLAGEGAAAYAGLDGGPVPR